jgi:hypothetical protein
MDPFGTLVLGHLIADFPLQTRFVFRLKQRHWAGVLLHSAIHCVVTALLLESAISHWPVVAAVGLTHFAVDWVKLRFCPGPESLVFAADQIAHIAVLRVIATLVGQVRGALPPVILGAALTYAVALASLTLLWALGTDIASRVGKPLARPEEAISRLVLIGQWAGLPLVVLVVVARVMGATEGIWHVAGWF